MCGIVRYILATLTFAISSCEGNTVGKKRPTVQVKTGDTTTQMLIDSGASVSVISKKFLKRIWGHWKIEKLPLPQNLKITGAGGNQIRMVDYVEMELEVLGRKMLRPVFVAEGLDHLDGILGWDTISEEGLVVDGAQERVYYNERQKEEGTNWSLATLRCKRRVHLKANCIQPIQMVPTYGDRVVKAGEKGICAGLRSSDLVLWDALAETDENNTVTVCVMNCSDKEIDLQAGDALGTLRNPEFSKEEIFELSKETIASIFGEIGKEPEEPKRGQIEGMSAKQKEEFIGRIKPMIRTPEAWKQKYLDLIMRYHDVISKDKFDLGKTDMIEHKIVMKDEIPIHGRQFRIPFEHEEILHDYVDELLKKGAIEPSRSPYNSAVFCVAKKRPPDLPDDQPTPLRVVLDYRRINVNSIPDRYTIRDVRECIDQVGRSGSKIFTTVDLTSGFWQQVLEESSRQYTAFTVPGKGTRYQWTVTPMGLQGSPASFARLMDFIMAGLSNTLTYIDDLLVHSKEHEEHLRQLEEVMLRLRRYGLKLNGGKTIWGASTVQYLGYTMTEEGISPSNDKLKALKEYDPPTDQKGVRQFVGLCNYFRFMIKDFSRISAPLTKLTGYNHDWRGGELPEAAMKSFKILKEELCTAPVVAYPQKGKPFVLHTDGSLGDSKTPGGLGAALFQEQEDGKVRVIGYASRGLKDHEKNYSAFLLELTAAVFGIEHFSVYLRGREFALYTDHKPLEKLNSTHTKTLNRLQQAMLEYDFTLNYRRGEENVVADFLSRNAAIDALSDDSGDAREAQERDPKIRDIRRFLESGEIPRDKHYGMWVKRMAEECFIEDGAVWKTLNRAGRRERIALYAPDEWREEIIRAAHTPREAGHGGVQRTAERLLQAYWWPGYQGEVDKFIKKCPRCQRSKSKIPPPAPLQPLLTPDAPNERVHLDLFGPLMTSANGNKYILVITDAFTKYTEMVAIEDKTAATVARAFLERWIFRFSAPNLVITDQGKEFCNKVLTEVCGLWGIQKKRTSPFHPETNAAAESYNRTIIKYMRAVLDNETTLEWEEWLPALQFSYNTHVHRSSKETPFYLTYLYDPRMPYFDIEKPKKMYGENVAVERFKQVQGAYSRNKESLEEAMRKRTEYFNERTKERKFEAGDRVLVYFPNLRNTKKANPKFFKRWHFFTVVRKVGEVNVEVREKVNGKTQVIHVNRVRHAHTEDIEAACDSTLTDNTAHSAQKESEKVKGRADSEEGIRRADSDQEEDEIEEDEATIEWRTGNNREEKESGSNSLRREEEQEDRFDPWFNFGRALFPSLARRTEEERPQELPEVQEGRRTRSRGPVEDIPLPKTCPAWRRSRRD